MIEFTFNVLLYVDGLQHSFSAAVYASSLLKHIPTMHLTVVQIQDSIDATTGSEYNSLDTWPVSPNSVWMQRIINEVDVETKNQSQEILTKTIEIFSQRGLSVKHEILVASNNYVDTAEAIIDYATKNSFKLIIMGTRGPSDLKGLIFGSFAHSMLTKSPIPVLLIKKLPQSFIDSYILDW